MVDELGEAGQVSAIDTHTNARGHTARLAPMCPTLSFLCRTVPTPPLSFLCRRLSEDGYDLSEGVSLFSERAASHKHARLAAHLVRGAVVHQRRSTLAFQQDHAREKANALGQARLGQSF